MPTITAKLQISYPDGSTQEAVLPNYPVSLGKAPGNDIVIADTGVSRQHATIRLQGGFYVVADLGSLNGVYVNGQRVPPEGQALRDGDKIQLGRIKILFRLQEDVLAPTVDERGYETNVSAPSYETNQGIPAPPPPAPKPPPEPPRPAVAYRVAQTGELMRRAGQAAPADASAPFNLTLDGRYELEAKIGQDKTGTLYRARRLLLNDKVAVRVLRPELAGDALAVERFRRQAQVAARVRHPNSVQFYDFGHTAEGAIYIVEELLSGRTLRDLILKERGLRLSRVIGIVNQLAGAVHAAHLNGIVIRDLKPETIFVETGPDGKESIKLGGYGLAKVDQSISQGVQLTGPLGVFGTPQYMSPELWLNRPLDSRSDVYSLGVIIFELLTGVLPFDSPNPVDLSQLHLNAPIPDLTEYGRGEIDEGIAAVVSRALAKEPNKRQPTALDLANELQAVSGNAPGVVGKVFNKLTGVLPIAPVIVQREASPVPAGEAVLPSVVAQAVDKGHGAFNPVVIALMFEAFLSRMSSGMIKTAVPLYALLVFGLDITSIVGLVLIQNIVPLLLRPVFGSLADKYGKKNIFMISLTIRTVVSVLYAIATLPLLFVISIIRGVADSAKGPSASAMIADHTDERHIAQAYSSYTTVKSTSGGIGEAVGAFALTFLIAWFASITTVNANFAVLDKVNRSGQQVEQIVRAPEEAASGELPGAKAGEPPQRVLRVEQRQVALRDVPIADLPKVVDQTFLRKALVFIFLLSTVFSALSLILVFFFIKEKKKEKKEKKDKKQAVPSGGTGLLHAPQQQPNVWAFAVLGAALTAPAYMVTGEFFTLLAVKLEVTTGALGWIKLIAETLVPLTFGPFFGWLADRIGSGKVIALRSVANLATSLLFWLVPSFAGTALLGGMMGLARAVDEIGKAAFKPTWGAIAAKVSSFDLANRSKTMGIMEGGVDTSDLLFPALGGVLLQYLSLGFLMAVRAVLAVLAEIYAFFLMKKYKI